MNENTPRGDAGTDSTTDLPVRPDPPDADADADVDSEPRTPELVGTLVRYDDAPDEYTVHPSNATEAELLTTWLTVEREDLVDPAGMR